MSPTGLYFPAAISINPGGACTTRGTFTIEASGAKVGGKDMIFRGVSIGGPDHTVDLAGQFNISLTGFASHMIYAYDVGEAVGSVVRGRMRASIRGGSVGRGVRFRPALSIDKAIYVSGDFSGMTTGGAELLVANVDQNLRIHASEMVWKNALAAPTRVVTASPFVYQNTSMYPELVSVRIDGRAPGSAAITRISSTKRGSSAIDTGATSGQFYLQNGDSLTVEYGAGDYPPVMRTQCALPQAS